MQPRERIEAMLAKWESKEGRQQLEAVLSSQKEVPALAKCLLAAIGPLERCRDKLIELRDSERMLGASAYERALIQYRINEANEALDIINRELGE